MLDMLPQEIFKDKNISCELKNELPNEKLRAEYRQCILKKIILK